MNGAGLFGNAPGRESFADGSPVRFDGHKINCPLLNIITRFSPIIKRWINLVSKDVAGSSVPPKGRQEKSLFVAGNAGQECAVHARR